MKAQDYLNIKNAEQNLNKLYKLKQKKENRISSLIGIDEFMGENNFWTFMLPASAGIILGVGMLLAQTFSLPFSFIAAGLIFGPVLFNMGVDTLKSKNIYDNEKLEKQIRSAQYQVESLKNKEIGKHVELENLKDKSSNKQSSKIKNETKKSLYSNKEDELNA